ncbi:MAG: OmpH family outer membrane protein [Candidatus Omnitrophica bacterium]|nr:OmpH family outer membrane protein [Candidatus Omnitrophota bacterium]
MKTHRRILPLCLVFSALAIFSAARTASADQYAFVDVAKIFDEYQKTKDNDEALKTVGKAKEEERETLVKSVRALKDELVLLTDEAKAKKQDELDSKIRELQDFDQAAKRELGERRNKLVREIFQDIDAVVQKYGERKGFDMIFNERALLYHSGKLDVTQEVLTELNKSYKKS